jgi:hypothetical protein
MQSRTAALGRRRTGGDCLPWSLGCASDNDPRRRKESHAILSSQEWLRFAKIPRRDGTEQTRRPATKGLSETAWGPVVRYRWRGRHLKKNLDLKKIKVAVPIASQAERI